MNTFKIFRVLVIILLPFLLKSCAKEEINAGTGNTLLRDFIFPFATKENHSAINIKADLSTPVKESWLNSDIKFGHFTSVLIEAGFVYAPTQYGVAKINRQNGNIIWDKELDGLARGNMLMDGNILFTGSGEIFYALNKNSGEILWSKNLQHPIFSAPLVIGDNVHICDTYEGVYAFDKKTGALKWLFNDSGGSYNAAMVAKDNKIYIANGSNEINCIDAISGKKIWEFNTCKSCSYIQTALIFNEDQIIFADGSGTVKAYTTAGNLAWQYKHPTRIYFKGVAVSEGKVIATGKTDFDKIMTICLELKTNKLLWEYEHGDTKFHSHATIVNKKYVLVGTGLGLDNVDLKTGKLLWKKVTKSTQGSSITNSCFSNFAITDYDLIYTTNGRDLIRFVF